MNYKIIVYIISLFLSAFALSGINFRDFFRNKHHVEANVFAILIIMALSYLVASFIISFVEAI